MSACAELLGDVVRGSDRVDRVEPGLRLGLVELRLAGRPLIDLGGWVARIGGAGPAGANGPSGSGVADDPWSGGGGGRRGGGPDRRDHHRGGDQCRGCGADQFHACAHRAPRRGSGRASGRRRSSAERNRWPWAPRTRVRISQWGRTAGQSTAVADERHGMNSPGRPAAHRRRSEVVQIRLQAAVDVLLAGGSRAAGGSARIRRASRCTVTGWRSPESMTPSLSASCRRFDAVGDLGGRTDETSAVGHPPEACVGDEHRPGGVAAAKDRSVLPREALDTALRHVFTEDDRVDRPVEVEPREVRLEVARPRDRGARRVHPPGSARPRRDGRPPHVAPRSPA